MWTIEQTDEIEAWITGLDVEAKAAIFKSLFVLREIGPSLGRPYVDSVKGSAYSNMKELRVQNKGQVFRIFFAFDPKREAILLIGGDKRGDKNFYETMIPKADKLYSIHLAKLRKRYENNKKKKI